LVIRIFFIALLLNCLIIKKDMNLVLANVKFIFVDIVGDFLYWPVWWYSRGFMEAVIFAWEQIKKEWLVLGLGIWLKNLFSPMFRDRSVLGRLISLGVRMVILVWRLMWFLAWLIIILGLVALWLILPVGSLFMVIKYLW
jgi:hypothetical protein